LFDTGASDVFIKNAEKFGIDLSSTDYVILSHGHWDHSWGLKQLVNNFDTSHMKFIAHPGLFSKRYSRINRNWMDFKLSPEEIKEAFGEETLSKESYEFCSGAFFLGAVPRTFEDPGTSGKIMSEGKEIPDPVADDSAIAFKTERGIVLLSGCSHSGIINLAKRAEEFGKLHSIIGGFHLFRSDEKRIDETIKALSKMNINRIYPCHCTGAEPLEKMAAKLGAKALKAGDVIII